jgi:hypothetical protein
MNRKLRELFSTPERFGSTVANIAIVLAIVGLCMVMIGLTLMRR